MIGLNPVADGENILSIQMIGLLVGGILWGVLGDKRGRLSVLFGSILCATNWPGTKESTPEFNFSRVPI